MWWLKKANVILKMLMQKGCISRCVESRSHKYWCHCTLPWLDLKRSSVQFWPPQFRKDVGKVEQVQHNAMELIRKLKTMSYEDGAGMLNGRAWTNGYQFQQRRF